MGYVGYSTLFCATTTTVKDRKIDTLSTRHTAPSHHLKNLADTKPPQTSAAEVPATLEAGKNWEVLSPHAQSTALFHSGVYLGGFIGIVKGGPEEIQQMMQHLFRSINKLFRPNNNDDTIQEDPISHKSLHKVDAAWNMQKVVLGWVIVTFKQVLTLLEDHKRNLLALINTTPPQRKPMIPEVLVQTTRHTT